MKPATSKPDHHEMTRLRSSHESRIHPAIQGDEHTEIPSGQNSRKSVATASRSRSATTATGWDRDPQATILGDGAGPPAGT
ncbi:MAG: hypothetical protein ABIQ86_14095 [Steroidobacteraceae bacterium]